MVKWMGQYTLLLMRLKDAWMDMLLLCMNVTAYTFEAVRTVFGKLFCTPKSSLEYPSLRVSGYGSSMNRTFIVDNCTQDDFGQ